MMITTLPPWTRKKLGFPVPPDLSAWNADYEPPAIGTRMKILAWGEPHILGTVVGFAPTHGWLMIWVRPDQRPEWHIRDNPDREVCMFAGIEMEPV